MRSRAADSRAEARDTGRSVRRAPARLPAFSERCAGAADERGAERRGGYLSRK
jgi:hypothetical protein